jgi:uncharacterized protein
MKAALAVTLATLALAAMSAQGSTTQVLTWSGTFTLPRGTQPSRFSLVQRGTAASVSLAPGRAAETVVPITTRRRTFSFRLPGRPADLVFVGRKRGAVVTGTVTQGSANGSFRLARGKSAGKPFLGTYASSDGRALELIDLSRLTLPTWIVDLDSGAFHSLYRSGSAFGVGAFRTPQPADGRIAITGERLTWTTPDGQNATFARVPVRQVEVRFPSKGATLSGTLTLPATPGPHPAVAWVHGSGPSLRDEGQFFVGILVREGIAVLNYDKRGNGSSTGRYPGEFPTDQAVSTYADDAAAAARFLAQQPEIDQKRVGLTGGSQAGWIVPLAALHEPVISFAILQSAPTVSVGETNDFTSMTHEGDAPLSKPLDQIDAQVRTDGISGFDPRPILRRLRIPMLWLLGGLDMNQPSALDVEVLQQIKTDTGADYTWRVFPDGNHGIFEVKTGLNSELDQSRGMPAAFFTSVRDWLHAHGLSRESDGLGTLPR